MHVTHLGAWPSKRLKLHIDWSALLLEFSAVDWEQTGSMDLFVCAVRSAPAGSSWCRSEEEPKRCLKPRSPQGAIGFRSGLWARIGRVWNR